MQTGHVPASSGHIFLSYRSIEADFALRLAAGLKNAGVNLWMDRLDGIRGGDDWRRQIENALTEQTCAAMIAALSPEYCKAEYCLKELSRANRLRIPIFPVLIRQLPKESWPLEIEGVQYVDFCSWRDEQAYDPKYNELLALIGQNAGAQIRVPPDVETQYLTSLIAELDSIKGVLEYVELGARTDEAEGIRPKPRLEATWAGGFSMLLDEQDTQQAAAGGASSGGQRECIYLKSIEDAVEKHPQFVLAGSPGSGKTTALRKMAYDAAQRRLAEPRTAPLPLFLSLPAWKDSQSVDDLIRAAWPLGTDSSIMLKQGDVLLYLDGLNEMGTTGPSKAKKLRDWLKENGSTRIVVTCRTEDYKEQLSIGLPLVEAEPLDAPRIRLFAKSYLDPKRAAPFVSRVVPPEGASESQLRFWEERGLFNLARNPYLLAALIYVHDRTPEGDLPRNMGTLFRMLVRALWERERVIGTAGWIPLVEMQSSLAALAFSMIEKQKPTQVPIDYALPLIQDEQLLRAAQSANLLEVRGQQVRFYHQLAQEYFAAVRLATLPVREYVSEPRLYWHGARGRIAGRWDQVLIALSGLVDPNQIVREILEVNALIAGDCIASGVNVTLELRDKVQKKLVDSLDNYGCMTWAAASVLAEIGDAQVVPRILKVFEDQDSQWRSWSQFGGDHDRGHKVADALLAALERIGDIATPKLIQSLADPEERIRHAAARALGRIRPVDAVPHLIGLLHDKAEGWFFTTSVAEEAVEALGQIKSPEASTIAIRWHHAVLSDPKASQWEKGKSAAALKRIQGV
jgi:hypothetical protein